MAGANGIQLDEAAVRRIEQIARDNGVTTAEVVQRAIARYWEAGETWGERARRLGLIGCVKDAPADLSTRPCAMEGPGE